MCQRLFRARPGSFEPPILERLGKMALRNLGRLIEISDPPRHLEHPVNRARGEAQALGRVPQRSASGSPHLAVAAQEARPELGIGEDRRLVASIAAQTPLVALFRVCPRGPT